MDDKILKAADSITVVFGETTEWLDPKRAAVVKILKELVEEKFTSTNTARDAIALLKQANEAHTTNWVDSWFTSNKYRVNAVLEQQAPIA